MQNPGRYKHHGSFLTCPVLALTRGDTILPEKIVTLFTGCVESSLRKLRWAACGWFAGSALLLPKLSQLACEAIFTRTGAIRGCPQEGDERGSFTYHVGLRLSMVLACELILCSRIRIVQA
jgi:hypothetical protein